MDRLLEFIGHHPLIVSAAALAALLVAAYEARLRMQGAAAVSPQELIRLMNQGALVLDLRPQELYAAGHINGARAMPSDQILKAGDSLKRYKEKLVIVYCDGGSIGAAAVRQLAAQGFTKTFSLRGGLSAWRAENLPLAKA
ncbi:MAG TPA: rhodanese-like domain-containing protein [Steroidobacteraceae bacterium]|nr:rhodanese-like domain-containing protein [Steroidobacteraceae bacterium]